MKPSIECLLISHNHDGFHAAEELPRNDGLHEDWVFASFATYFAIPGFPCLGVGMSLLSLLACLEGDKVIAHTQRFTGNSVSCKNTLHQRCTRAEWMAL
jgi:hypothetical protein